MIANQLHGLDENAPILNLGYYRSTGRCLCGHEVIWGEHEGDAVFDEAWRAHFTRASVLAFRAAQEEETL